MDSDNKSKLSTERVTKAIKHSTPKSAMDFAASQRRNANNNFVKSENGVIPSVGQAGKTRRFLGK